MCGHCGCSSGKATLLEHDHARDHHHGHQHEHGHEVHHHGHDDDKANTEERRCGTHAPYLQNPTGRADRLGPPSHHTHADLTVIEIERSILGKNDRLARFNRRLFSTHGIAVLNLVSSPGSGKTAILERTIRDLSATRRLAVVVGDLATDNDAKRLRTNSVPAIQISTGTTCHLDAHMVGHALEELDLDHVELLFIENVGNLVCPAAFDLGEDLRVVVTSVTEGEDKPLKYPVIFEGADIVLVSKIDLATAVDFKREQALRNIAEVAPRAKIMEVSSKTGKGMAAWYETLERAIKTKRTMV